MSAENDVINQADLNIMESEAPRNTKRRGFFVTTFDLTKIDEIKRNVQTYKSLSYAIAARDWCPTTGREHVHWYFQFNTTISWNSLRKKLCGSNVAPIRTSPKQVIKYVCKTVTDENPVLWEFGDQPHQGSALTSDDLRRMSVLEVVETDPRCHRAYLQARELIVNSGLSLHDLNGKRVEVYYIYGSSGCGKSVLAKELLRDSMIEEGVSFVDTVKYKNEFWTGVCHGEFAWYDEFRDSDMKPSEFISFIDYNPQRMNIKGGSTLNRYRLIVITSIQGPMELYPNMKVTEPRKQWLRRVKWINLDDPIIRKCVGIEKLIEKYKS